MELNWNVVHVARHGDYKIEVEGNPEGCGWDWAIFRDGLDEWEFVEESNEPRHLQLALLEAGQALEQILVRDQAPVAEPKWNWALLNAHIQEHAKLMELPEPRVPYPIEDDTLPEAPVQGLRGRGLDGACISEAATFAVLQALEQVLARDEARTDADSIAKHKDAIRRIGLIDELREAGYSLSPAQAQQVLTPDPARKPYQAPAIGTEIKLPDDPNQREDVVRLLTTGTSSESGYQQILNTIKAEAEKLKP